MKNRLHAYLEEHWNKEATQKIQYSVVPEQYTGDLSLNFFALSKEMKKSPRDIATEIQPLMDSCPFVESASIDGPYLNITFNPTDLFKAIITLPLTIEALKGQKIVIEYSGPNTNKPLHLGHMRNHATGIALVQLLQSAGATVYPVNIVNDRGVHICKSMLAYQRLGNGETPESTGKKSDHFVGKYYVEYDRQAKEDESWEEATHTMLKAWEDGDPETQKLWKTMSDWALSGHQETYKRQGVQFEKEYYESDIYKEGKAVAQQGLEKGVFQKEDDGSISIDLTADKLDKKTILRANGTSLYITQDLALALQRKKEFSADKMIYVVASEQEYHFRVLALCLEKLGLLKKEDIFHFSYQLVMLPDGRLKSREGTTADADDIMDNLAALAAEEIRKRDPELSDEDVKTRSEQIMDAAWKYYLLSPSANKTITFNPKESIAFEGATGPYLQYAGARIRSIFHKSGISPEEALRTNTDFSGAEDAERKVAAILLRYPDVLESAALNYNPTRMASYLLELAQAWSGYYASNQILNSEEPVKSMRLALAASVFRILEAGLANLGITIPERM